jgi:hypothetical protein
MGAVCTVVSSSSVRSQNSPAKRGGQATVAPSDDATQARHKDPLGNFCLEIETLAHAHVANRDVYDHVVGVKNRCVQLIKCRVCYARTNYCVEMDVPGGGWREALLGIRPFEKAFAIDIRERL